jgi:hydroxymethylpyrimidine/phosphomethylpyrimidine kinase
MAASAARDPIALTIAGSDPSGGAGIQADLKTFTALGVYGASVVTALTAQNTHGVTGVQGVPQDFIAAQIKAVMSDLKVSATKTGMLGDRATVATVVSALKTYNFGPVIVDPVMVATSGDVLLAPDAIDAVRGELISLAALITPNLHEAAKLLETAPARSISEMDAQAQALLARGARAVLIKGGHHTGDDAIDLLATPDGVSHHSAPRLETSNTHGTGCTLSAAIAARLALGETDLRRAVSEAKAYLWGALNSGRTRTIGSGCGPVDHLFRVRDS